MLSGGQPFYAVQYMTGKAIKPDGYISEKAVSDIADTVGEQTGPVDPRAGSKSGKKTHKDTLPDLKSLLAKAGGYESMLMAGAVCHCYTRQVPSV